MLVMCFALCCGSIGASTNRVFSVGYEEWPPFQSKVSGHPTGIDIQIMNTIADRAGRQVEFVQMPWSRILSSLQNGQLDMAMAAVKRPEREQFAYFSKTSFREGYNGLFVHKDSKATFAGVRSLSDLVGREIKLAVTRGNDYSREFSQLKRAGKLESMLVEVKDEDSKVGMLSRKRIDGFLSGLYSGSYAIRRANQVQNMRLLMLLHDRDESASYLMFSKATVDRQTVAEFDRALSALRQDGTLDKILEAYVAPTVAAVDPSWSSLPE